MKLLIGADIVPSSTNVDAFSRGDAVALVGEELLSLLRSADYRIFNLEIPLTDKETPMPKAGVCLIAPTATVNGMKALGADILGLSNNHMLDQGYEGMRSTIDTLDKAGILHLGGGENLEEAKKPLIIECDGVKVGIYACCEHEFSWAQDYGHGANGFDPLYSPDDVAELKAECDYVIVLYHGGKEHFEYPSPNLRRVCRRLVEKGADLVLCQHTHCVGAEEDYKGGKILYGQGNFLFARPEYREAFPLWDKGLLVSVDATKDGIAFEYIPLQGTEQGTSLAQDSAILEGLRTRSEEIKDEIASNRRYAEFAAGMIRTRYIQHMVGQKVDDEFVDSKGKTIFHYLECDAHHEALHVGLKYRTGYPQFGGTLVKDK